MEIKEIQDKLITKLKFSGWSTKLRGFLLSSDFESILQKLYNDSQSGKKFTPILKNIFRAFEECEYDDLKVVMISMDPYPGLGVADGVSFSCSLTEKEQPSLRHVFNAIEKSYPDITRNPDLTRWSNQGILMLNAALTCEVGKSGSHIKLWKPFITYLFDILNSYNSGLIFVFLGKDALEYESLINDKNHFKLIRSHPASAAYNGGKWDDKELFKSINDILEKNYHMKIEW